MTKNQILLLILIFIFALFIRAYNLPEYSVSSDHVAMPLFVIDSFPENLKSFFQIDNYGMNNPLRLLAYPYSIIQPIYYFIFTWLFSLFNVPINETFFILLNVVIGTLTVFAVYVTINKLYNQRYAVISSLVIALIPLHVMQSRFTSSARIFGILLQFFALYCLIQFFNKPDKNAFKLSISLSLVMLASILFPPFLLVGIYTFIVYNKNIIKSKQIKSYLKKNIFNFKLLTLPILTIIFLFAIFFVAASMGSSYGSNITMLGHLFTKKAVYGFYLFPVLGYIINGIGPALGMISLLVIPFGLRDLFRFNKKGILLVWSFVYILPFLLTQPSNVRAYIIYGIVPLAIYGIIIFCKILRNHKVLRTIFVCIILFSTLLSAVSGAYNIKIFSLTDVRPGEGSFYKDLGVKAIGYWIRTNTNENVVIFTDETIEPPVGKYYFHREVYSLFDSNTIDVYKFFLDNKNKIDYIVVSKENYLLYNKNFFIIVESESNSKTYYILGKEKKKKEIIDVKKYNELYNKQFSNLESIMKAPDYVSQFPDWM